MNNSPADLEIYFDLAQVYEQDRRFADAEQAVHSREKACASAPSDRETATFSAGRNLRAREEIRPGRADVQGRAGDRSANAPVLNYYGYMLADRGMRLDEAVALVQRALAQDPTNPAYLDSIGWAYYKQNKLAEAEAACARP